jgi:DNA-binding SARP family transcriptional activator
MGLGQWATLDDWLSQLPAPTLERWPSLVYTGGELAAAEGRLDAAKRAFALASRLFSKGQDSWGACHSLLAESAVAIWRDERALAEARAQAASEIAAESGAHWHQSWAAWYLGRLSVEADDLDAAITYFDRAVAAAAALDAPLMTEVLCQAQLLATRQRELRCQSELYRQAFADAEASVAAHASLLNDLFTGSPAELEALLEAHGWSPLPLMLKLQAPHPEAALPALSAGGGLWDRLLNALGIHPRARALPNRARQTDLISHAPAEQCLAIVSPTLTLRTENAPAIEKAAPAAVQLAARVAGDYLVSDEGAPMPALALQVGAGPLAVSAEPTAAPEEQLSLTAYLLGQFHIEIDGRLIGGLPIGRGLAMFKYLLAHHTRFIPREILMETFWPSASPEAARNSLNVAVHSVRQALRSCADAPLIIYRDGAYGLNPSLALWVDIEAFEQHFQHGRRLERDGQSDQAAADYDAAISLYTDDFLADEPYEEWPVQIRERLRMVFLEALDQRSQIALAQGGYSVCASLCQRMLAHDSCREDAHCRLMRCYSRQGQAARALRQYQDCVEILRRELDVEPSLATAELAERLRRREQI